MTPEEAIIGTRVRVRKDHRAVQLRGQKGTIQHRWGDPNYLALDVLLDNGLMQLFWFHELQVVEDGAPA